MAPPNMVKNLLDASKEERQKFIDSFDLILTDCDCTVWYISRIIEGASAGVSALQDHGKKIVYVSNNAVRTEENYLAKFKESNIPATFDDVMHPGISAVDYLNQTKFEGLIYVLGSTNVKQLLTKAGYEIFDGPQTTIEENFSSLLRTVVDKRPVKAVIIDWDYNLSLAKLMKAHLYLQNPECKFIACATDVLLPWDLPIIGPGLFLKLLQDGLTAIKRPGPIVVGKPGAPLKDIILKKYNVDDPKRILFIGDSLEADIGFGKVCGFQTLAVLTGATTKVSMMTHENQMEVPDYYLDTFADFTKVCEDLSVKGAPKL